MAIKAEIWEKILTRSAVKEQDPNKPVTCIRALSEAIHAEMNEAIDAADVALANVVGPVGEMPELEYAKAVQELYVSRAA